MKSFKKKAVLVLVGLGFSLSAQLAFAERPIPDCEPSPEFCYELPRRVIHGMDLGPSDPPGL